VRRTLDAYFSGVNEDRFDDVAALFAPDATLTAPGVGPLPRDEIAAYLAKALSGYPKHHDEPTRTLLVGHAATVEITFTGETTNGTRMTFDALDVFDFDADGRITRLRTWFDSHELRKKLRS
jgi:ketosteroid isomerase-like protein